MHKLESEFFDTMKQMIENIERIYYLKNNGLRNSDDTLEQIGHELLGYDIAKQEYVKRVEKELEECEC